jgi:hypothetical protein
MRSGESRTVYSTSTGGFGDGGRMPVGMMKPLPVLGTSSMPSAFNASLLGRDRVVPLFGSVVLVGRLFSVMARRSITGMALLPR